METQIIEARSPAGRRLAVEVLKSGGLVAFPTDTVYGLAADPADSAAVQRLYDVKQRPEELPIPLLLSDVAYIGAVASLPERCQPLVEHFWPGALTLVLSKTADVPATVSARPTVAVRVPHLELARSLIRETGGVLAVTSANVSGEPSPVTAEEVKAQLGGRIPLILDGGACPARIASTIVDCTVSPPRILRGGGVSEEALRAVVGSLR